MRMRCVAVRPLQAGDIQHGYLCNNIDTILDNDYIISSLSIIFVICFLEPEPD